jgi:hypothetical protein
MVGLFPSGSVYFGVGCVLLEILIDPNFPDDYQSALIKSQLLRDVEPDASSTVAPER